MMSLELLLDAATDARIRAEWTALQAADLPSQGRHTGASNAPHITLLAAQSVDATLRPSPSPRHSAEGGSGLPVAVHLSGLVVFGGPPRGLVLARLVAVTADLKVLHTHVHRRASGVAGLSEQTSPDHWTPHVTLASRLTPAQLASAIEVLAAHATATAAAPAATAPAAAAAAGANGAEAWAEELRHWNGDTKTVTTVIPPPS